MPTGPRRNALDAYSFGNRSSFAIARTRVTRVGRIDAEISTVGPSLSGNRGNAAEFAAHAALRRRRLRCDRADAASAAGG